MTLLINVELQVHACPCGLVYALPQWVGIHQCPTCASRNIRAARDNHNETLESLAACERTIAALRGVVSKLKARGQGKDER